MKKVILSILALVAMLGVGSVARADAPGTPSNLSATATSLTTTTLNWGAVSNVQGYEIYRNSTSTPIGVTSDIHYTDTGLSPATLYTYYVVSFDASSTKSTFSAPLTVTTLADTSVPTVPTNLAATPVSASQINLTWTAASDNIGVTGYNVFRNGNLVATTTSLNYSDTGLAATTTYTYAIRAYDAANNISSLSAAVSATTLSTSTDTSAPTVPSGLTASPVSSSQINLAWTASSDNFGVAGYRIFRNAVQIATTTHLYYSDRGLAAATSYTYNISAFDATGNISSASGELTATTLASGQTATGNVDVQIINGDKRGKRINYRSNEIIKLVVFSSSTFSATDIVKSSVLLGGTKAIDAQKKDYNKDGLVDMIYSFRSRDFKNLNGESNILTFSATTSAGQQVYASATVVVNNAPNAFRKAIENKIAELKKQIEELKAQLQNNNRNKNVVKNQTQEVKKNFVQNEKKVIKAVTKMVKKTVKMGKR